MWSVCCQKSITGRLGRSVNGLECVELIDNLFARCVNKLYGTGCACDEDEEMAVGALMSVTVLDEEDKLWMLQDL